MSHHQKRGRKLSAIYTLQFSVCSSLASHLTYIHQSNTHIPHISTTLTAFTGTYVRVYYYYALQRKCTKSRGVLEKYVRRCCWCWWRRRRRRRTTMMMIIFALARSLELHDVRHIYIFIHKTYSRNLVYVVWTPTRCVCVCLVLFWFFDAHNMSKMYIVEVYNFSEAITYFTYTHILSHWAHA